VNSERRRELAVKLATRTQRTLVDTSGRIDAIAAAFLELEKEVREEILAILAVEDIENDPDDLYTGRWHRLNRIRALGDKP
jgi:hypothetical protein